MKIKLFLSLFFIALAGKGFSQEKTIEIQPQKEVSSSVSITPVCGNGNEMELPFTVFWDKKAETLKVEFKSNKTADKMLLFFTKKMPVKQVMKLREDVWFAKEVKKCQTKKNVNLGVDIDNLVNIEEPLLPLRVGILTLDFSDKNASMSFLFNKPFQNQGDIVIPFHLYVTSKDTLKGKRTLKVEYEALFTLVIKKRTETAAPAEVPASVAPQKEKVNCKTLYKANEQLAELLLDIKNSTPANLASLKQKYASIKKSVANPEYKNCKEEYKSFESLCSKIDNRLK